MNVKNSARGGSLSTWRELTLVAHQRATNATRQAATCNSANEGPDDDDEEARRDQDGENASTRIRTVKQFFQNQDSGAFARALIMAPDNERQ
jgi:hypothetical protein